jgi:hypothetical protein
MNSKLGRIGAIVFVVAAVGYAVVSFSSRAMEPTSSESNKIWLLCEKCDKESGLSSDEFAKLRLDQQTARYPCPKCGASAAMIFTMRCPHCNHGFFQQGYGSAPICPYCKKSLAVLKPAPDDPLAQDPNAPAQQ